MIVCCVEVVAEIVELAKAVLGIVAAVVVVVLETAVLEFAALETAALVLGVAIFDFDVGPEVDTHLILVAIAVVAALVASLVEAARAAAFRGCMAGKSEIVVAAEQLEVVVNHQPPPGNL